MTPEQVQIIKDALTTYITVLLKAQSIEPSKEKEEQLSQAEWVLYDLFNTYVY